jgi:hypothetical protein
LLEETAQGCQMRLAKISDGPKVRFVAGGQHAERHVFDQPPLDSPRRKNANAVGVHQHLRQHDGVIRRIAAFLVFVHGRNGRQVQLIDQITHKEREMALRQPVPQARW